MDSSQLAGGSEECSSSESGWTTYLASPMHGQTLAEDDDDPTSEEDGGDHGGAATAAAEDGDSLASDASSGPPNRSLATLSGSFDPAPIPIQDSSEEEEHDKEDLHADNYVSRKSLKKKEKKREDCDSSVSPMAEDGETIFLAGEDLAKK